MRGYIRMVWRQNFYVLGVTEIKEMIDPYDTVPVPTDDSVGRIG